MKRSAAAKREERAAQDRAARHAQIAEEARLARERTTAIKTCVRLWGYAIVRQSTQITSDAKLVLCAFLEQDEFAETRALPEFGSPEAIRAHVATSSGLRSERASMAMAELLRAQCLRVDAGPMGLAVSWETICAALIGPRANDREVA